MDGEGAGDVGDADTDVDVEIESLAPGGDAAGRQRARSAEEGDGGRGSPPDPHEGRVVFVPLAAPGERVRVRLARQKERVAWGELVAIERPGPDRVAPSCRLFGSCGGCQWQHVTLAAQRAAKKAIVERALGVAIGPVRAAGPELGYRDRAQLAVGADAAPASTGGRAVGFRARRSNQIVDVPACPLLSPALAAALPAVRALGARLSPGAEIDLQAGAEGVHVNVSHADAASAAHARGEIDRLAASGIVGLALGGRPAFGRSEVDVSEAGGSPLPVPAGGFAQVGAAGNAALVAAVLEAVGGEPGVVLELHAGSGNFTRHLAARATCVLACDADAAAVERGRRTVPAARWSGRIPEVRADVVLLDPPREGADASHLGAALRARRRIVYVSCDPQTLARDARRITAAGFRLAQAVALDLMPQTFHVEVVATFERSLIESGRLSRNNEPMNRMNRGFTLVELMIVVVILGILAAIGTIGYRKWIGRARSGEAVAMLAEMSSKEQSYKLEFATYLPLRADNKPDQPSPDEADVAFYPLSASSTLLDSARTPNSIADPTKWPQGWAAVGLRPRDTVLYCTYLTNAGTAGSSTANLKFGSILIGANTGAPWFYSLAACNLDPTPGYPDNVSIYALSSQSPSLRVFNEGK